MKRTFIVLILGILIRPSKGLAEFHTIGKWTHIQTRNDLPAHPMDDGREEIMSLKAPLERSKYLDIPFLSPLDRIRVTCPRGWRGHPVDGSHALHQGVDLVAYFVPVHEVMDDMVESVGNDNVSGTWIRLIHPGGVGPAMPKSPCSPFPGASRWYPGSRFRPRATAAEAVVRICISGNRLSGSHILKE
jgi:hypothetical protein